MLSKYSLADIDFLFSANPIIGNLGRSQRILVYNQAQNAIAELFKDDFVQITNYSISDNKLTSLGTKERNTINELKEEDKESLKLGSYRLGQLTYLIDELEDFNPSERQIILNIAQDILTRVKNDYDALGYYQLWYDIDALSTYTRINESRFKTTFVSAINVLSDFISTIYNTYNDEIILTDVSGSESLDGSLSFKTNFIATISKITDNLAFESRFKTSFTTLIASAIKYPATNEARFKTSFTTVIYIPVTFTLENESRFKTSFTTTIT